MYILKTEVLVVFIIYSKNNNEKYSFGHSNMENDIVVSTSGLSGD